MTTTQLLQLQSIFSHFKWIIKVLIYSLKTSNQMADLMFYILNQLCVRRNFFSEV